MILENFYEPNFRIYSLDPNQDTEVWHLDKYYISIFQRGTSQGFVTFSSSCMKEFYCDSSFGITFKNNYMRIGYARCTKIFEYNLPISLTQKLFELHQESLQSHPEKLDKTGKTSEIKKGINHVLSTFIQEKLPEHCI